MVGEAAISLAGHDRLSVYIIVAEDERYVWLSDGKTRKLNAPKKKNKKHIQLIHLERSPVNAGLESLGATDEELKHFLKYLEVDECLNQTLSK